MFRKISIALLSATTTALAAMHLIVPAQAALIVGGSSLLTPEYASDLEGWLGEGPLVLTKIFAKASGYNAEDFHIRVDGQGRTFSLIEAFDQASGTRAIIGGYNPQSWNAYAGFHITIPNSERTAFLFNLSAGTVHRQLLDGQGHHGNEGIYQTYNYNSFGPTFGGGGYVSDIYTDFTLSGGLTYVNSYANPDLTNYHRSLITNSFSAYWHDIGELEVFRIGPQNVEPVPEASSIGLATAATVLLLVFSLMRRRAEA
jgi:hypothetical protein